MFGFTLDPSKLAMLAQGYDPTPVLSQLATEEAMLTSSGHAAAPYASSIMPGEHDWMKRLAPLDPRSLAMLNSMMPPGAAKPQFIGGAAPRTGQSINIQAPNFNAAVGLPAQQPPSAPPSLASIIGGR